MGIERIGIHSTGRDVGPNVSVSRCRCVLPESASVDGSCEPIGGRSQVDRTAGFAIQCHGAASGRVGPSVPGAIRVVPDLSRVYVVCMIKKAENPDLCSVQSPPVMETSEWVADVGWPDDKSLLDVSQAAPTESPPDSLLRELAHTVLTDRETHTYGPILGLPDLRAEIAARWSSEYRAEISPDQVAVTSGCNQAFCAAALSLCRAGDALLVPVPWYFNHGMWLGMTGVEARPLPSGDVLVPDPDRARALLDRNVKGIVLVTPNNPTGTEYPSDVVDAFFDLAQSAGIALIVDETYRDFDSRESSPHGVFARGGWDETFIHVYSFSKAYRLTGHRVGALVSSPSRISQIEKFLDTVSICPNQLAQRGALFGLRNLAGWKAREREKILRRRAAVTEGFLELDGWNLKGCGAYFAYVEHPFDSPSREVSQRLLREQAILTIPGSMFVPVSSGPDHGGDRHIRIAFANIGQSEIRELFNRLRGL